MTERRYVVFLWGSMLGIETMKEAHAEECRLRFIVRGKNNLILHQRHAIIEKEELK